MARSEIRLRTVVSTLDAVAHCTEFAAAQSRSAGFSLARTREVELAVEEIVANICRHGYAGELGEVEVVCRHIDSDQLEFEFVDRGRPFDMLTLPESAFALDIDQRDMGGVGVRVLRALIDGANYRREGDRNVLCVIVRSPCRLGAGLTGC